MPQLHGFPWLLRFYQCDRHGTQLTPNFEWRKRAGTPTTAIWAITGPGVRTSIICWPKGWDERRLTLSNTYRDATSNQYCLTAGQFFDNGQRLLLIDIDAAGL